MQNEGQKPMQDGEQAIRDLVNTWLSASKAGDTEKVVCLFAGDVVCVVTRQPRIRGKAAFAATQSSLADIDMDASSEIQEIRVLGEWAYLWNKRTGGMTPKQGGSPVKRAGDILAILQKQNGKWVLFRDANMLAVVSE